MRLQGWTVHCMLSHRICQKQSDKQLLHQIRGEFMRASRIFQARPDRPLLALAQLCEERVEEDPLPDTPMGGVTYIPPRLTPLPPQTPYTVGSSSMRPQVVPAPVPQKPSSPTSPTQERKSPQTSPPLPVTRQSPPPPEHMGPTRSKWTSPPPPDAPDADLRSFEDLLGAGLLQATAATDAREAERSYASSASNSEIFTDDGRVSDVADLDDVRSVRSFTEESSTAQRWSPQVGPSFVPAGYASSPGGSPDAPLLAYGGPRIRPPGGLRLAIQNRGRAMGKPGDDRLGPPTDEPDAEGWLAGHSRRSISGPPRTLGRYSLPSSPVTGPNYVLPRATFAFPPQGQRTSNVLYETNTGARERSARAENGTANGSGLRANAPPFIHVVPPWQQRTQYPHHLMDPRAYSPAGSSLSSTPKTSTEHALPYVSASEQVLDNPLRRASSGLQTPTPTSGLYNGKTPQRISHGHTHSSATIVAPVTPPAGNIVSPRPHPSPEHASVLSQPSGSGSPSLRSLPADFVPAGRKDDRRGRSPHYSPGTDSPAPSSSGSSRYTSPPSTSPSSPTRDKSAAASQQLASTSGQTTEPTAGDTPVEADFVQAAQDMSLKD